MDVVIPIYFNNRFIMKYILNCLESLSSNTSFQVQFPIENPNNTQIFHLISGLIVKLCEVWCGQNYNVMSIDQAYELFYRPFTTCLRIISHLLRCRGICLCCDLLYNDTIVIQIVKCTLATLNKIPKNVFVEYPHIVSNMYSYIESLNVICTSKLSVFNEEEIVKLFDLVEEGLKRNDSNIINSCTVFIESFTTSLYRGIKKNEINGNVLEQLKQHLLVFANVCFDNLMNNFDVWRLSRPLQQLFIMIPGLFDQAMYNLLGQIKQPQNKEIFLSIINPLKNEIGTIELMDGYTPKFFEQFKTFVSAARSLFN